jgi:hypothetical protein
MLRRYQEGQKVDDVGLSGAESRWLWGDDDEADQGRVAVSATSCQDAQGRGLKVTLSRVEWLGEPVRPAKREGQWSNGQLQRSAGGKLAGSTTQLGT